MASNNARLKITFNSPTVIGFTFLCFLAMVLNILTDGETNRTIFITYHSSLKDPMTYLRLVTYVLGHANWSHFLGNISYILLLGPTLEDRYGSRNVMLTILVTAIITGLINYIFFPASALCGASGVVFAFILLISFTGFRRHEIPISFILVTIIFLGQQIYESMTVESNISYMAHIVGGVIGALMGYIFNRKRK